MYTPSQLNELMSVSDYVVMSTPYTPQTDKVIKVYKSEKGMVLLCKD